MAMFHCSVKICAKRGGGKSSVAAAAYRACESIEDDRTGITHDFTHKGGHVYGEVMLCENAPEEYQDRAVLWNEVEKIEKNSNARTAREVEVSLPIELDLSSPEDLERAKSLIREYVNDNFISRGMCADWNIHNPDDDNHNPHCHIMLTTRPFKENGEWGTKEKKAYKLDENGNRIPIIDPATGEQKLGARNRKMWERKTVDSTGWNNQELVEEWRESWADKLNVVLEEIGATDRVDHRSYERQGKNIEATIHEGIARKMEERYSKEDNMLFISDRINMNNEIKEINAELSSIKKMISFCKSAIDVLKEKIEVVKKRVAESVARKKEFLGSLIRGDNFGGIIYTGRSNTGSESDPSELQRADSADGEAESGGSTDEIIRAAEAAIEGVRNDRINRAVAERSVEAVGHTGIQGSDDTDSFIRQAEARADSAISDRKDRDAEQERLEAKRAEQEAARHRAEREQAEREIYICKSKGRGER